MTARERERREFERLRALTCSCGHRTTARDYYAAVRELALHVHEQWARESLTWEAERAFRSLAVACMQAEGDDYDPETAAMAVLACGAGDVLPGSDLAHFEARRRFLQTIAPKLDDDGGLAHAVAFCDALRVVQGSGLFPTVDELRAACWGIVAFSDFEDGRNYTLTDAGPGNPWRMIEISRAARMAALRDYRYSSSYHTPPAHQGQIVEIDYGCTADYIYERALDRSDRTIQITAYLHPEGADEEWSPWSCAPDLGEEVGVIYSGPVADAPETAAA